MQLTDNYSTILATIDKNLNNYSPITREFKFLDSIEVNKAFEGTALNKTYQAVNGDFINACQSRIASVLGSGVAQRFKVAAGTAAGGVVGVVLTNHKKEKLK